MAPPRAQPPEDAVQNTTVIDPRHAAHLCRQKWLDHRPLEIRQIKASHLNLPVEINESEHLRAGNPVYGYVT